MSIFEFRRHSIKDGTTRAMIGPKGYALAREVGREQLRGKKFTNFFCSSRFRTHQTLAAFAEGAGDMRIKDTPFDAPIYGNVARLDALLRAAGEAEKRGEDLVQAALAFDHDLAYEAAADSARLFRNDFAALALENARVLVVGHSPAMELMVLGLTGDIRPGLKECQGFRIEIAYGSLHVEYATGDLDPSAIRARLWPDSP